jgi:hypothetical protein
MQKLSVSFGIALWLAAPTDVARAQCVPQQLQKIPGQGAGDGFPGALALDGDRLLVGRPNHSPHGIQSGEVLEFSHSAGTWVQVDAFAPNDGQDYDSFGFALALDGDRVAVGAAEDDDVTENSGAVYVFEHVGSNWVQTAKIKTNGPGFYNYLGGSVALSGDRIAAGAEGAGLSGAVYIFERSAGAWTQKAKLTDPSLGTDAGFGVSLSMTGERLLIGAWFAPSSSVQSGAAYVFDKIGSVWIQSAVLTLAAPMSLDRFGTAVALRNDVAVVSAPLRDLVAPDSGGVYVFRHIAGAWQLESTLAGASAGWGDLIGNFLAFDGDRILASAEGHDAGNPDIGAAYLFQYDGTGWFEAAELRAGDPHDTDHFGRGVALENEHALVGAPFADAPAGSSGALYVFDLGCVADIYCTPKVNSAGCVPTIGFQGQASASSATPFLVTAHRVLNNKSGVLFYGYSPASQPFQGGIRCIAPPLRRTPFQNAGGNPPPDDCSGQYVMTSMHASRVAWDPALVAGVDVFAQHWTRDPAITSTTGLTDALRFEIAP